MQAKRQALYDLVSDADSSKPALYLSYYFDLLVLVSMLSLFFQTVPEWHHMQTTWFIMETVITGHFAVRILVRLICCPRLMGYVASYDFVLDMVCIAPWPLEFFLFRSSKPHISSALRFMRVLCFIRLLQCKIFRVPQMRLFGHALCRSKSAFLFLFGYGLVSLMCFSWAIFLVETSQCTYSAESSRWLSKGDPSRACPLQNMFESLWMCLCTVITVGYGDYYPVSAGAKALSGIMMISSFILLPLPVTIFGANLTELYLEARMKKKKRRSAGLTEDEQFDDSDGRWGRRMGVDDNDETWLPDGSEKRSGWYM